MEQIEPAVENNIENGADYSNDDESETATRMGRSGWSESGWAEKSPNVPLASTPKPGQWTDKDQAGWEEQTTTTTKPEPLQAKLKIYYESLCPHSIAHNKQISSSLESVWKDKLQVEFNPSGEPTT